MSSIPPVAQAPMAAVRGKWGDFVSLAKPRVNTLVLVTTGLGYLLAKRVPEPSVLFWALVGTGFVIANRARLTNVGGEGQIAIGGIAATAMSLYGGCAHLPFGLSFIVPMLTAAAAGAVWGGVPGVLTRQPQPVGGDGPALVRGRAVQDLQ